MAPTAARQLCLARLSFWVPAGRTAEFQEAYCRHLLPLLGRHGLAASAEPGRPTIEGVFSRLFAVGSPAQVAARREALQRDPEWREALRRAARACGVGEPDKGERNQSAGAFGGGEPLRWRLAVYRTPAGPGTTARVGPGYRQGLWQSFGSQDGLPFSVLAILRDRQGVLWMASSGGGVCRFDGAEATVFTTADGLLHGHVRSILEDRHGNLWFGVWGRTDEEGGVSRYDGREFVTFAVEDGLPDSSVGCMAEDRRGDLWFGTFHGGACRYPDSVAGPLLGRLAARPPTPRSAAVHVQAQDPRQPRIPQACPFTTYTPASGLADSCVLAIHEDHAGSLWFATSAGLSRRDGDGFVTFRAADGLADDHVRCLTTDRSGRLWAGTAHGLSCCDDPSSDRPWHRALVGLPDDFVRCLAEDREGGLWVGTYGGLCRHDDHGFRTFTVEDGLANNQVFSLSEDPAGNLWVGTCTGVSCCHKGQFASFTTRDGLASDALLSIAQDRAGDLWIATEGGVTRYQPSRTPPAVALTEVIAERRHGSGAEVEVPASHKLVAFAFQGRSWTTRPDGLLYAYRLGGANAEWRVTRDRRVEYRDLATGDYTFEVKAVDRDLNCSEPAAVRLRIVPDARLQALTQALSGPAERFVGHSAALGQVQSSLQQVAPTDLTVLILGETGTGKGLAARALHRLSPRAAEPLLQVSCGALPEGLVESELFGHEKGAFTGAVARKLGKVELAEAGTLFLDEVGDLPLPAQAKLLQVLEERTFTRVGGTQVLHAKARVIAATNRDLAGMVAAGQFRQDLYYRLQGFTVHLPPLRQRQEDIPELALFFATRMAAHLHKPLEGLEPAALALLHRYPWPGNVRELEHAVQRSVVVAVGPRLRVADLALPAGPPQTGPPVPLCLTPQEYKRQYVLRVLEEAGWVIKGPRGAAARLGISPSTLHTQLKRLGLVRPQGR
ncbi:MAG: sigma 54-interacting transcriptional regulator [Candidatus Latescibacterota bacterium]